MRPLFSVVALLLLAASVAVAQPVRRGPPIDLVAAPPVVAPPVVFPPVWGGLWGGFYGNPWAYPGFYPPPVVMVPPPAPASLPPNPARMTEDADRAAATATATLTLELPAAGEVWVGEVKQASSADATRVLTSPALPLGREFRFEVRARWADGGTTYETRQTTTVRAGERGKLAVYAGTPVK